MLMVPTPNWELPLLPSDIPKLIGLRYTLEGRLGTSLAMTNVLSMVSVLPLPVRRYMPTLVSLISVGVMV